MIFSFAGVGEPCCFDAGPARNSLLFAVARAGGARLPNGASHRHPNMASPAPKSVITLASREEVPT